MGVPSFFKWLTKKWPRVVTDVKEERIEDPSTGRPIEIDTSRPNPNGQEFDCLYLDMNGIIHPCCHPEDKDAPPDEESMLIAIGRYIDRIFAMVRPRRVLYMAIDGVAPRAKMNQQRSRRFRSALDTKLKEEEEEKLREQWKAEGKSAMLPPKRPRPWDSNVITPGTPFMEKVSNYLHYYIQQKLSGPDPGWRQVKIIFSDARVPGEGEHKIMRFIRLQRAQEGYDPKTRHCLYGMDADLIMLGLASHEPYFTILREEVLPPSNRTCQICGQAGHFAGECQGVARKLEDPLAKKLEDERKAGEENASKHSGLRPFQFLHINILREYLERDLYVPLMPPGVEWDLERMIDDFVFICFFVGNDFLPHLPSLEIREGAIDHLIRLHKQMLPQLGGYLTENGRINMWRVAVLLQRVGAVEDDTFRRRKQRAERDRARNARLNAHRQRERERAMSGQRGGGGQQELKALGGSIHDRYMRGRHAPATPGANAGAPPLLPTPGVSPAPAPSGAGSASAPATPVPAPPSKEANLSAAQKLKDALKQARMQKKRKAEGKEEEKTTAVGETSATEAAAEPGSPPRKRARLDGEAPASASSEPARTEMDTAAEEQEPATPLKQQGKEEEEEGEGSSAARPTLSVADALSKLKKDKAAGRLDHLDATPATPSTPFTPNASAPATPSTPVDSEIVTVDDDDEDESPPPDFGSALKVKQNALNEPEAQEDTIQLGLEGWKERYYTAKLGAEPKDAASKPLFDNLFKSYAEGLAWVFEYYYRGVPSWTWYYPFHYAPMASDLASIDSYFDGDVPFQKGKPFTPITQLMGVLPPLSGHCLPTACRELMTKPGMEHYYPEKFDLDLNGKKFTWQAVALLPFIKEEDLVKAVESVQHTFTEDEKRRNSEGKDYLYVHQSSGLSNTLFKMYTLPAGGDKKSIRDLTDDELDMRFEKIDPKESGGVFGGLRPYREGVVPGSTPVPPFKHRELQKVEDVPVFSAEFYNPAYKEHLCKLITNELPPRVLTEHDFAYRGANKPRFGQAPSFHQQRWQQNAMEGRNFDGEASYHSSPYGVPRHGQGQGHGYGYPPPIFPGLPPPPPHLLPGAAGAGTGGFPPPPPPPPGRGLDDRTRRELTHYLPSQRDRDRDSGRDSGRDRGGYRERDYRDSSSSSSSSGHRDYYGVYPQQHHQQHHYYPPPAPAPSPYPPSAYPQHQHRGGYQHPPPPPPPQHQQPAGHSFRHPSQQQQQQQGRGYGASLIRR